MNHPTDRNDFSIYLVDDHMIFRQSFEAYLSTQTGLRFVGASDGQENTLDEIIDRKPDVVLLDFHLERENGFDILRKLREKGFMGKIVFLTMNRDSRVRDAVRSQGANGFVSKDADGHALLDGLRSLMEARIDYLEMPAERRNPNTNPYQLTKQEWKIANLVCSGLNSEDIAEKLFISIHTVHTHRRRILEKTASGTFMEVCRKLE